MILIALHWIILTFSLQGLGSIVAKIRPKQFNRLETILLGLVTQTIVLTFLAFFVPMKHWGVQVYIWITFLWGIVIISPKVKHKTIEINKILNKYWKLGVVFLLLTLQSAQIASFPDQDSYYIPTVRWAEQFGLVKGLANWNYFLGQYSPWHILYAAYDGLLPYKGLGLNGWFVMLTLIYFSTKNTLKKGPAFSIPIALYLLFTFLFIDGMSPDVLPLFLVFYLYLNTNVSTYVSNELGLILLLWVVFVKIIYAPLLLLLVFKIPQLLKQWQFWFGSTLLLLLLFGKNYILTGYVLFPFPITIGNAPEWAIPNELFYIMKMYSNSVLHYFTGQKFMISRLELGLLLIYVLTITYFLFKETIAKTTKKILVALLFHLIILMCISLQFRFFYFGFALLITITIEQVLLSIPSLKKIVYYGISIGYTTMLFFQLIPQIQLRTLNISQCYAPLKKEISYTQKSIGNITYYAPNQPHFFYEIGDIPLPSNTSYWLNYMKNTHGLVPIINENNLNKGFIMNRKKIKK